MNKSPIAMELLIKVYETGEITESEKDFILEKKKENFDKAQDSFSQRTVEVEHYPIRAKISLHAACNVKCNFCSPVLQVKKKALTHSLMADEKTFRNWLKIIPFLTLAEFFREGESFLFKDFWKVAKYAKNVGVETITNSTNGMLIDENTAQKIIDTPLDVLKYSVQGVTQNTLDKVQPGAKFKKIFTGMEYLSNLRSQRNSNVKLLWSMVLNRYNYHEIVPAIKTASDLGFDCFFVHYVSIWSDDIKHLEIGEDIKDDFEEKLMEASKLSKSLDIKFTLPILKPSDISDTTTVKDINYVADNCFWPWTNVELEAGGAMIPCCGGYGRLGELRERNFEDIWFGKDYNLLRKSLSDRNLLPACSKCRYAFRPDANPFKVNPLRLNT